jgi:hypothetical protein
MEGMGYDRVDCIHNYTFQVAKNIRGFHDSPTLTQLMPQLYYKGKDDGPISI